MADQYQVSSLTVWVLPEWFAGAKADIVAMRNAELVWSDGSNKMVVTLKAKNRGEITESRRTITSLRGVLNVF